MGVNNGLFGPMSRLLQVIGHKFFDNPTSHLMTAVPAVLSGSF